MKNNVDVNRVEVLTARGYTPDEGQDQFTRTFGMVVVQVTLSEYEWVRDDTRLGHMKTTPLQTPLIQAYLPHSCDEWVIAPPHDDDPVQTLLRFSTDVADAAAEVAALTGVLR